MTPKKKKRLKIVLFILVLAIIAISLVFSALGQNMNHYYELSSIKTEFQKGNHLVGKTIRIGGMVADNSIKRQEGTLKVDFVITNYQDDINVQYEGVLPDLFREGQGVLAKGELVDKNHFIAKEILAKHDENYMPKEVKEELEKTGYYKHAEKNQPQGEK